MPRKELIVEEKFVAGVIGGVGAGIIKDIPDLIFRYLAKITRITFWDYSGTVALGHSPRSFPEIINAAFYEVVFSIFIGIVFVYLAPYFKTKYIVIRGAIYGALVWFVIRAGVIAFQIKILIDGDLLSATLNSLNSILYGIVLAMIINYLEEKGKMVG